jgi:hypothetical protein
MGWESMTALVQVFMDPYYNYRKNMPLGSLSTVFSVEVLAILRYTEILLNKNLIRREVHNCFDSKAALAALVKATSESSLVWECMQVLGKVGELNKVTLVWIPKHQGIPGNEEADRLATEEDTEIPPNQFTGILFSVGKKTHQQAFGTEASGQVAGNSPKC